MGAMEDVEAVGKLEQPRRNVLSSTVRFLDVNYTRVPGD